MWLNVWIKVYIYFFIKSIQTTHFFFESHHCSAYLFLFSRPLVVVFVITAFVDVVEETGIEGFSLQLEV